MTALALAGVVSDTADYDYEMALHGLRANARQNTRRLREAIGQLPPEAHPVRQLMLSIVGSLGETIDDANLLEKYALMPMAHRGLDGESAVDAEERQTTTWMALFALARMRERAEQASSNSIKRVLRQADSQVARTLFLELEIISGIKSEAYRDILQRRGMSTAYVVPSGVTPLEVAPIPGDPTLPPPATN